MKSFTAAHALLDLQYQKNFIFILSFNVFVISSSSHVQKKKKVLSKREEIDSEDIMKTSKSKIKQILEMLNPDLPNISCPLTKKNERSLKFTTEH